MDSELTGTGAADAAADRGAAARAAAWTRAEEVARTSYGRLIAVLTASTGDIQLAEDCLGDAFQRALTVWPRQGLPEQPEAWLLTAARNRQRDDFRSAAARSTVALEEALALVDNGAGAGEIIPDRRLALLFTCAHPAIAPEVRAPLMLQTVLGFQAKEIARAFALPEATLAQRLVRAKRRIREARLPFAVPTSGQLTERLQTVLETIYGAYAIDWLLVAGPEVRPTLAGEALFLASTLADLLPDEPEPAGLAALIALSHARANARHVEGRFVPLDEQDPARWDATLISWGESLLSRAARAGRPARFQIEAAIQSAHCARATIGVTDWKALRTLYAALVAVAPTLGARAALAATIARIEGPEAGLTALDAIDDPSMHRFQPAWATRAHLLAEMGRADEAVTAYVRAISLTTDPAVRRYLEEAAARTHPRKMDGVGEAAGTDSPG